MTTKEPMIIEAKARNKGKYKIPAYEDIPMVKGTFKNIESPGVGISFPYRGNWKGLIRQYEFWDGGEYTIPEELANHLNGHNSWSSCHYKTLRWISQTGEEVTARPISHQSMPEFTKSEGKKTARFLFQITERLKNGTK